MARLSVEHFRANSASTMTPDRSRKTTRLRDMFKSRSSISPPTFGEKRKDSADVSPLTSPALVSFALKPGFEKVGLLPSERNSLAEARQNLDTTDEQEAENCDDATTPKATDKRPPMTTRKPSNGLEDAFREVYEKHQKERAEDEAKASKPEKIKSIEDVSSGKADGLYVLRPSDDMSSASGIFDPCATLVPFADEYSEVADMFKKYEIDDDGTSRFDSKRHSQTAFVGFSGFVDRSSPSLLQDYSSHNMEGDETFVDSEADVMPHDKRASFASNIFDNTDSLSQGIREYVETKIALAQVNLQRELHDKTQSVSNALRVTIEFHVHGPNMFKSHSKRSTVLLSKLFRGTKSIGPCTLGDGIVTETIQIALIAILCMFALGALFKGLGAVLCFTLQLLCLLSAYIFLGEVCGWPLDTESDMLLAPVSTGVKGAFALLGRTFRMVGGGTTTYDVKIE